MRWPRRDTGGCIRQTHDLWGMYHLSGVVCNAGSKERGRARCLWKYVYQHLLISSNKECGHVTLMRSSREGKLETK